MRMTITNLSYKGAQYRIKAVEDKNGYREEITCSQCHVFYDEEHLFWLDPETLEQDYDAAPFCRVCYENALSDTYRLAA